MHSIALLGAPIFNVNQHKEQKHYFYPDNFKKYNHLNTHL